jgi:nucleoside-diphosphate-sugar epimerase
MILLTGSSGFLGTVLMAEFHKQQLAVATVGRSPANTTHCDLSKEVPALPLVDTVVHAAGKAHIIPASPSEVKAYFDINVQGTRNLLAALEHNGVLKKFIFISSVAVYGLTAGCNISEDMPLLAEDPYGKSKITAEKLIINWCLERGISYYILRLPLVAGKHAPANLRDMVNGIKKGNYLSIGKAPAKKSMVLATDVARLITTINGPSGIYNLTDGYHPSFNELETKIACYFGKKKPLSLPLSLAKVLGVTGDIVGKKFPVNSTKLKKIISTLTFSDARARDLLQWKSREVLKSWEIE